MRRPPPTAPPPDGVRRSWFGRTNARDAADRIPREYLRFYIPLGIQTVSQALTHPLVGMVASQGPGGAVNLAGVAQANLISFLLQTVGFGLLTTGMIYGRSRAGFALFRRVAFGFVAVASIVHLVLMLPGPSHLVFGVLVGLPPSVEEPARIAFVYGWPIRFLFQLRLPYQIALLNAKQSGRASAVSMARIALTLVLAPLFVSAGWVGPEAAQICLAIPVLLEAVGYILMSRPYRRSLPDTSAKPPKVGRLLRETMPLSLGTTLMVLSGNVLGAMIARAAAPEAMLPVYYLAYGLAGPLAYAAQQMQRVVLAFAPGSLRGRRSARLALRVGLAAGMIPLVMQIPPLRDAYFFRLQRLDPQLTGALLVTALLLVLQPLMVSFRALFEAVAAYRRRPPAVLAGYAAYLGAIFLFGSVGVAIDLPGNLVGAGGLIFGNVASIMTIAALVTRRRRAGRVLSR